MSTGALLSAEKACEGLVLVTAEGAEGGKGRAFPVRFWNEDTRRAASVAAVGWLMCPHLRVLVVWCRDRDV